MTHLCALVCLFAGLCAAALYDQLAPLRVLPADAADDAAALGCFVRDSAGERVALRLRVDWRQTAQLSLHADQHNHMHVHRVPLFTLTAAAAPPRCPHAFEDAQRWLVREPAIANNQAATESAAVVEDGAVLSLIERLTRAGIRFVLLTRVALNAALTLRVAAALRANDFRVFVVRDRSRVDFDASRAPYFALRRVFEESLAHVEQNVAPVTSLRAIEASQAAHYRDTPARWITVEWTRDKQLLVNQAPRDPQQLLESRVCVASVPMTEFHVEDAKALGKLERFVRANVHDVALLVLLETAAAASSSVWSNLYTVIDDTVPVVRLQPGKSIRFDSLRNDVVRFNADNSVLYSALRWFDLQHLGELGAAALDTRRKTFQRLLCVAPNVTAALPTAASRQVQICTMYYRLRLVPLCVRALEARCPFSALPTGIDILQFECVPPITKVAVLVAGARRTATHEALLGVFLPSLVKTSNASRLSIDVYAAYDERTASAAWTAQLSRKLTDKLTNNRSATVLHVPAVANFNNVANVGLLNHAYLGDVWGVLREELRASVPLHTYEYVLLAHDALRIVSLDCIETLIATLQKTTHVSATRARDLSGKVTHSLMRWQQFDTLAHLGATIQTNSVFQVESEIVATVD